jgi:hypothetical protein
MTVVLALRLLLLTSLFKDWKAAAVGWPDYVKRWSGTIGAALGGLGPLVFSSPLFSYNYWRTVGLDIVWIPFSSPALSALNGDLVIGVVGTVVLRHLAP